MQLYGSLLVSCLNETQCRTAELADLEARRCAAHWSKAPIISAICIAPPPKPASEALQMLALGETTTPDSRPRRWLERRRLIDGQGQLNIPVLGRWIVEEEL